MKFKILAMVKNHFVRCKNRYVNIVLATFFTVLSLEILSFASIKLVLEKNKPVNSFLDNMRCSYLDMLIPHPYLGYVYGPRASCKFPKEFLYNQEGFLGAEMPAKKSTEDFYILLTGGSVANMLSGAVMGSDHIVGVEGRNFLEDRLNKCYLPQKGFKKFIVLNVAVGAWKQPQQAVASMLFGDRVNAIVTLDGYNEYFSFNDPYTGFELPANYFGYLMKLRLTGNKGAEILINVISALTNWHYNNPILKHSQSLKALMIVFNKITNASINPNVNPQRSDVKVSYAGQFGFSPNLAKEKREDHNILQYLKYLKVINSLGNLYEAKTAFFYQPVSLLHKPLTEEEKNIVLKYVPNPRYMDKYSEIEKKFLALKKDGLDVYSLTKIYQNTKETVYSDTVHAKVEVENDGTYKSLGYSIMSQEISAKLAKKWHFISKHNPECGSYE